VSADLLPGHLAEHGEMKHWLMKPFLYLLRDEGPGEPDIKYWLTKGCMGDIISGRHKRGICKLHPVCVYQMELLLLLYRHTVYLMILFMNPTSILIFKFDSP
jgi:hypothetical protein